MHMKKLIFGVAVVVGFAIFFSYVSTAGAISYPQAYTLSPWDDKLTGNNNPELFPDGIFNGPLRVIPHPTDPDIAVAISGNLPNPTICIDYFDENMDDAFADGVWLTQDKGETWDLLMDSGVPPVPCPPPDANGNLPNVLDADMALDGNNMVLLIGTWKDGVFLYKEETGTCENISDGGVIIEPGAWNQPGHCMNYQHDNHTFDNQCDDTDPQYEDPCAELLDCGPNIKPHRWAVSGVKIADINTYYVGIADTTYTNILAAETINGSGDHPGFYKTTNGGSTWTRIIQGVYSVCKLSDPFACLPYDSMSQTCAPSSIDIYPLNIILAGMADVAVAKPAAVPYQASTQAKVLKSNDQGASWSNFSQGLEGIEETQTVTEHVSPGISLTLSSLSTTIVSVSPSGTKVALGHLNVSVDAMVPLTDVYYQSRGVYELLGSTWSEKNNGFVDPVTGWGLCNKQPCEPNPFTEDEYWGINVGPISFNPNNENVMSTGIIFCGVSNGINSSGPYIFSPPMGTWIDFTQFSYYLGHSPNQACLDVNGNPMFCQDSSASMASWSNDGLGIYSPISWTDALEIPQPEEELCNILTQDAPDFTGDDGIYFLDFLLRGYINYE